MRMRMFSVVATKCWDGFIVWLAFSKQLIGSELDNLRRIDVVVTVANPGRTYPNVDQARPTPTGATLWVNPVINLCQTLKLRPSRLTRDTFIPCRALTARTQTTDEPTA